MDVLITVTGPRIRVSIDGSEVIDLIDPEPLLYGGVGIGGTWEALARFDDVVVVPEPGTVALLLTGALTLRLRRRPLRRRRR